MRIDIAHARSETPACEAQTHLSNAGAALSLQPVLDTVITHLNREAEIGGYEAVTEPNSRLQHL